ncbi:NAD(P)/FAD-dependent oxidoreductase [Dyadobacter chenwenxiniae]|uniref:NAD(P)/FAD-dependent oxidoreductase n=1 Tax=Dyadobacter chenwenxiniae TaxID=2906456 RepID=A0A9X1PIC3_9BACT|nr:NAD(P)/FAD-dependent oxidoreductase [Dyadobacter chenwenxiniae]MCF0060860.1 NAD(P)/FAD-dependent oxidoreductase [Dyadobacter chenwenxiniae]UON80687.1 NAD(P)/FAD-dependent oxidoreductase [Dyadobacter chenwenxiniae]
MMDRSNMRIAIVGGGASGFMAAITAAEQNPEAKIVILEKNKTVLNKVRVSGGGRCNVTHNPSDLRFFIKNYPRGEKLLRKLLHHFDAKATVRWFEERGVKLKTEADGRMFPVTDSSQTIIECMVRTARNLGIEMRTSTSVRSFTKISDDTQEGFSILLDDDDRIYADKLLIASGGYPKASGFDWLQMHNHSIINPLPSLFTFNTPENYLLPLAGVSVQDALVKISGTKHEWQGPLLITHWGFSGPAVLKLSAWGARDLAEKEYHFICKINWLPQMNEQQVREFLLGEKTKTPKQQISSHARLGIPARLWKAFVSKSEIPDELRWSDATNKALNRLTELLTNSQFEVKGKTTFKEEFVTCGGISLNDIDHETLESNSVPGLYFSGEVLDVDGITGGFNFQNAWTTGYIAGKNMAGYPALSAIASK